MTGPSLDHVTMNLSPAVDGDSSQGTTWAIIKASIFNPRNCSLQLCQAEYVSRWGYREYSIIAWKITTPCHMQARFRVYGHVSPVQPADDSEPFDLAHVFAGGRVVLTSDQHFGIGSNLIIPGRGDHPALQSMDPKLTVAQGRI